MAVTTPVGQAIPAGYMFDGATKILGFEADIHFEFVAVPLALKVDAKTSPFALPGVAKNLFALYESLDDAGKQNGPRIHVDFTSVPFHIDVNIAAAAVVLDIASSVSIQVSDTQFAFEVTGNVFGGLLKGDLAVSAGLGANGNFDLATAGLKVHAALDVNYDVRFVCVNQISLCVIFFCFLHVT
jgi:hypothetical protein